MTTHSAAPRGAEDRASGARLDVTVLADMTCAGDRGYRIAEEVRHFAATGLRVGLVQACEPGPGRRIAPEIETCVRRGLAEVVADAAASSGLLIVHAPGEFGGCAGARTGPRADRTVFVCHRPQDYIAGLQAVGSAGAVAFAPVDAAVRKAAPPGLRLTPADWRPFVGERPRHRDPGRRPSVGWVLAGAGPHPYPAEVPDGADVFVVDLEGEAEPPARFRRLSGDGCPSLDRLAGLDALVLPAAAPIPETLVAAALAAGCLVVVPEDAPLAGEDGVIAAAPDVALATVLGLLAGPRVEARRRAAVRAGRRWRRHAGMDRSLIPSPAAPPRPARPPGDARPIMFLPSNGVGLGHVSRLLAVARRVDPDRPVLFASQAQAVEAIEQFGFLAEYIPSATYIGGRFDHWDAWFRHELERLLDDFDPAVVVYDGNNPSDGLIEAVASRRDCRLAWVRRGLWGDTDSRFMANARWFDLVVEPGELDGLPDEGVTARRRAEAVVVPPVVLIDEPELPGREEAARALGLDPARPAALIHLGAGFNRDIVSLIDRIVEVLQRTPGLQIAIAEWVNGAQDITCWPGVTYLRGFPISQHVRAFDFSIGAAGYNSFHEMIAFGLPTVFIPNRHPSMDDQAARAEHAQDLQAAFVVEEDDLDDLDDLVRLLVDERARDFLVRRCRAIRRPNGAGEIAAMLERLAMEAA